MQISGFADGTFTGSTVEAWQALQPAATGSAAPGPEINIGLILESSSEATSSFAPASFTVCRGPVHRDLRVPTIGGGYITSSAGRSSSIAAAIVVAVTIAAAIAYAPAAAADRPPSSPSCVIFCFLQGALRRHSILDHTPWVSPLTHFVHTYGPHIKSSHVGLPSLSPYLLYSGLQPMKITMSLTQAIAPRINQCPPLPYPASQPC